ncbi:hypothetical protein GHT06_022031 [Daphnia sinensis]|uniref:Uncharacterized protein n=1 Tax=Daphnia sinensis TaxID=1820382 RepID=A0AAD5KWD7_9CRUS|nr:hypothetical protein GHT06_022031 [Daphnia sinensis]
MAVCLYNMLTALTSMTCATIVVLFAALWLFVSFRQLNSGNKKSIALDLIHASNDVWATHNGRCGFNFAWMDGWMEKLAERLFFCPPPQQGQSYNNRFAAKFDGPAVSSSTYKLRSALIEDGGATTETKKKIKEGRKEGNKLTVTY